MGISETAGDELEQISDVSGSTSQPYRMAVM